MPLRIMRSSLPSPSTYVAVIIALAATKLVLSSSPPWPSRLPRSIFSFYPTISTITRHLQNPSRHHISTATIPSLTCCCCRFSVVAVTALFCCCTSVVAIAAMLLQPSLRRYLVVAAALLWSALLLLPLLCCTSPPGLSPARRQKNKTKKPASANLQPYSSSLILFDLIYDLWLD